MNSNNNGGTNSNNEGFKRVNGETRSRNFAKNKRNFNRDDKEVRTDRTDSNRSFDKSEKGERKDFRNNDYKGNRDSNRNNSENRGSGERRNDNRNSGDRNKNFNRNDNRNENRNENRSQGENRSYNGERKNNYNRNDRNDRQDNRGSEFKKERFTDKNYDSNKSFDGERRNNFNKNDNRGGNRNFENKGRAVREENHKYQAYENDNAYGDVEVDDDELENLQLEGRNAVLEAIRIKRPIDKILLKKGEVEGTLKVIKAKALAANIIVQETAKSNLDEMAKSHNHQGVIAFCSAQEYAEVEDMLELAKEKGEDPFIVILDGITDTYNLGAIIRSANAAGAHGVIIPKRRAAGLSAMVSKASAGAILYTKVARVTNISTEIEKLKAAGLWIVGTDLKAKSLYETELKGPVAVVIGSEGTGISRLVKEKCDLKVSIPMIGEIESLNASVASGVLMYEIVRQRLNG